VQDAARRDSVGMPRFLIQHSHEPPECGVVFAAFKGHDSPLRHRATLASCAFGGHVIWWHVEALNETAALALLPSYVAARAIATRVREVDIP
jgi:hypothetical protein